MLDEILKKESISEDDLAVLSKNLHLLSEADLVRFGFASPKAEVVAETVSQETEEVAPKVKKAKKL